MRLVHSHGPGGVHWGLTGGQTTGVGIVWLFVIAFLVAMAGMLWIAGSVLGHP